MNRILLILAVWLGTAMLCPLQAQPSRVSLGSNFPASQIIGAPMALADGVLLLERSFDEVRWLQLDPDGRLLGVRTGLPYALHQQPGPVRVQAVGDGHVLLASALAEPSECRLSLHDATGLALWVASEPGCLDQDHSPSPVPAQLVDAEGELWVVEPGNLGAARFAADGEALAFPLPQGALQLQRIAARKQAGGAHLIYRSAASWTLAQLGGDQVVWRWSAPAGMRLLDLLEEDDGTLLLLAAPLASAGGNAAIVRIRSDGSLLSQRELDLPAPFDARLARLPAGQLLVLAQPDGAQRVNDVHLFGADGEFIWQRAGNTLWINALFLPPAVAGAADGFGLTAQVIDPSQPTLHLELIELRDGEGSLQASRFVPALSGVTSALTQTGNLLHIDERAQPREVIALSAEGESTAPVALQPGVPATIADLALSASGERYVLARQGEGDRLLLQRIDADGQTRWTQPLTAQTSVAQEASAFLQQAADRYGRIVLGETLVCVSSRFHRRDVLFLRQIEAVGDGECFRRDDGAAIAAIRPALASGFTPAGLLQAEVEDCQGCASPGLRIAEYGPDSGALQETRNLDVTALGAVSRNNDYYNVVADIDGAEGAIFAVGNDAGELFLLHDDGGDGRLVEVAGQPSERLLGMQSLSGAGMVLLHSWAEDQHRLRALDLDGQLRWEQRFAAPLFIARGVPAVRFRLAEDRLLLLVQSAEAGRHVIALSALDARSGVSLWSHRRSAAAPQAVADLAVDLAGGALAVLESRPGGLLLRRHALDDGEVSGQQFLACGGPPSCLTARLQAGEDGAWAVGLRGALETIAAEALVRSARLDQRSLLGTWFDPATRGQGVFIDFDPASGNLVGGWFAFAEQAPFGRRGLAWYTFGGRIEEAADNATLTLYRNRDGQFDSAPITEAVEVGAVELRLRDCNRLQFNYAFDEAQGGAQGSQPLQRLIAGAYPCTDADGTQRPATPVQAAANAIPANRSGAWFEPESAGQGLLLELRPAAAADGQDGLLLGGWFSYDPEGDADDADAQHWFLLQGQPAEDDPALIEAVIYRASGGSLDARPTDNTLAVGEATLRFASCESATLDYRFDTGQPAGSFAGLSGSLPLIRLLPCGD